MTNSQNKWSLFTSTKIAIIILYLKHISQIHLKSCIDPQDVPRWEYKPAHSFSWIQFSPCFVSPYIKYGNVCNYLSFRKVGKMNNETWFSTERNKWDMIFIILYPASSRMRSCEVHEHYTASVLGIWARSSLNKEQKMQNWEPRN